MTTPRLEPISTLSVDALRTHVQTIINNARSSEPTMTRLATRNWDDAKMGALQSVLDTFVASAQAFDVLRARKNSAATAFDDALSTFRRGMYREQVDLVDAAFTGDASARSLLRLDDGIGDVNTAYASWGPQAADFYERLLTDDALQPGLAAVNVTRAELQSGADAVQEIADLYEKRGQLDGQRQQARRDRDADRKTLQVELRRFQKIASVVLRDRPDLLEPLGFIVDSE